MKISFFFTVIVLLTVTFFSGPVFLVHAQANYQPLAPLPGTTLAGCDTTKTNPVDPNCQTNLATYLPGVFKLAIAVAGALAVIMIVIGGVQYLSTDAIGGKSEGKAKIQNALTGLLLAIAAYVILYTINPKTLTLTLSLQATPQQAPAIPTPTTPGGSLTGTAWPSDADTRTELTNDGIQFNNPTCAFIGDSNCTSVYDLSTAAIQGVEEIKADCGCNDVIITGGTEYWLHGTGSTDPNQNTTAHRPGGSVLDLSLSNGPQLAAFLRSNGTKVTGTGCTVGTERYTYGNGLYVNEVIAGNPPHWHVCYQ